MKVPKFIARMAFAAAVLGFAQLASAGETPSAFDAANQAYLEGKPAEAARNLEGVIAKQGYSGPVLFNLANAQLREGKTGQAVLNYERARWLAPADPDIAANLRLASEHTQPIPAPSRLFGWADWFAFNVWADFGVISLLLLTATLPLALVLPARRRVLRCARIAALMALLSSLAALGVRWGELNRAVVTAKSAEARISPVTVGTPLFTLPEGTVVTIVKSHGPFTLVSAGDGRRGWVNRDTVGPVVDPAS